MIPSVKNDLLYFKNYQRGMRHPFVFYADFECFTEKVGPKDADDQQEAVVNTARYQKHVPSGFCFYLVCPDDGRFDKVKKLVTYTGVDAAEVFIKETGRKGETSLRDHKV